MMPSKMVHIKKINTHTHTHTHTKKKKTNKIYITVLFVFKSSFGFTKLVQKTVYTSCFLGVNIWENQVFVVSSLGQHYKLFYFPTKVKILKIITYSWGEVLYRLQRKLAWVIQRQVVKFYLPCACNEFCLQGGNGYLFMSR